MSIMEFKLPDIGEGIAEGEIVKWLVSPGDSVAEHQSVVEVMTDKATVTIPSGIDGRVVETRGEVGEVVAFKMFNQRIVLLTGAEPSLMRFPLAPAGSRGGGWTSAGMISTVQTPLPIFALTAPKVCPHFWAPSPESETTSTVHWG